MRPLEVGMWLPRQKECARSQCAGTARSQPIWTEAVLVFPMLKMRK